jgi:RNA polymerase sigma factor (sigma-70 family)
LNDFQVEAASPGEPDRFAELLRLAGQGQLEAQELICKQYERQVRIVARVLLGPQLRPHLDTTDVMQSVHRSLLIGLRDHKFDISTPEKLVALACSMVRRKVARKWRRHRRQVRWDNTGGENSLLQTLSSLSSHGEDPQKAAEYQDELARLFADLTPSERTMIERRLEGFTTGEVAAELGIPPVTVRVRWNRLRKRLEAAGVYADWM